MAVLKELTELFKKNIFLKYYFLKLDIVSLQKFVKYSQIQNNHFKVHKILTSITAYFYLLNFYLPKTAKYILQ